MQLKESGILKLPSGRLLSMYKNSVAQKPGLNDDVLKWMQHEADKLRLESFGREGGLILDEMAIQVVLLDQAPNFIITVLLVARPFKFV